MLAPAAMTQKNTKGATHGSSSHQVVTHASFNPLSPTRTSSLVHRDPDGLVLIQSFGVVICFSVAMLAMLVPLSPSDDSAGSSEAKAKPKAERAPIPTTEESRPTSRRCCPFDCSPPRILFFTVLGSLALMQATKKGQKGAV